MRIHPSILAVIVLVAGQAAGAAGKVNQRMIDMVGSGKAGIAVASWWGFDPEDSTDALQAAIDSGAKKLVIDNPGKPWIVRPIRLTSNQEIILRNGVEVIAKRGEFKGRNDSLFRADNERNITLTGYGATLRMHRSDYASPPYEKAEWRHALSLMSCSNVKVYGLTLAESGGDGIYLGVATRGVTNMDIHIKDVVCDRNYRQGISVISAENLLIENTIMRDTAGTPPAAGIDFEPNKPDERLVNIVMRNCTTEHNQGDGYLFFLGQMNRDTDPVSIRFEKCTSVGEDSSAVRMITGNAPGRAVSGVVEFVGCTFERSARSAITLSNMPLGRFKVRFVDCRVCDPAPAKPELTPIVFQSRADATEPVGGVSFVDCQVSDPVQRNLMSYTDGAGGIPVQGVTGTFDVVRNGKHERIRLSPGVLAKWMPPPKIKHISRLLLDVSSLKPRSVKGRPEAYSFGFARLRRIGRFVLCAEKGDEVSLRFAYEQLGEQAGSSIPVSITDPSGKEIRRADIPFRQESPIGFTAPESGTYRIAVEPGGNTIRVVSSSHPININGEDGRVHLVRSVGDYVFRVPASVREFGIRVSGDGSGEGIRALLIDPSGEVVREIDNASQVEQFEVSLRAASQGETWILRLAKPAAMPFEDHTVDIRGIPPLLAPSADALLVK